MADPSSPSWLSLSHQVWIQPTPCPRKLLPTKWGWRVSWHPFAVTAWEGCEDFKMMNPQRMEYHDDYYMRTRNSCQSLGSVFRTQVTIPSIVDTRLLPLHQPMLCLKHWSNTNEALVCVRHCACDSDLGSKLYACPRWPQLTQAPSLFRRLCTEPYSGAHY